MGVIRSSWAVNLHILENTFAFIPTIVYAWRECKCANFGITFGNLALQLERRCNHEDVVRESFEQAKKIMERFEKNKDQDL